MESNKVELQTIEYNQPTAQPTAKVAAVGKAGVVAVLIPLVVTLLAGFGVVIPEDISGQAIAGVGAAVTLYAAIQAVIQFAAGYLKKSNTKTIE